MTKHRVLESHSTAFYWSNHTRARADSRGGRSATTFILQWEEKWRSFAHR